MKQTIAVAAGILLLMAAVSALADEPEFQTTSREMIQELTREPVKYRTFVTKKRTIMVAQRIDDRVEETVVEVDESIDVPKLKLKIEFDYNSSVLNPSSHGLLKELVTAIESDQLKGKQIMINGHTDSDGTEAYNRKLSFDRAEAVKIYLKYHFDIPDQRLLVRGFGESLPLQPNVSARSKQMNRRVEFEVVE